MANKKLFGSAVPGTMLAEPDTKNLAGGKAYSRTPAHDLAQLCCTGRLTDTYYADAKTQLETFLSLLQDDSVDDETLAKVALYARDKSWMRDMPVAAGVVLSKRNPVLWAKIFDRIIDGPGSLRSFVQIIRSGKCGRKSLGHNNRKLIKGWFAKKTGEQLFRMSVGNSPTLGKVIKLAHVGISDDAEKEAVLKLLCEKPVDESQLPQIVRDLRAYRNDPTLPQPSVPIEMILDVMDKSAWLQYAKRASLRAALKNLVNFNKNEVFKDKEATDKICGLLRDKNLVAKEKILPYTILQAVFASEGVVPPKVINALHDCLELTIDNVPAIDGKVYLCVDVSGSMQGQVSDSKNALSTVRRPRYVDIAALFAAALMRKNREAVLIPFDTRNHDATGIRSRDSVATIAGEIAKFGGGGTSCELPLMKLNAEKASGDVVIYISDNESWLALTGQRGSTGMMGEWRAFKQRNPKAKLITIDIAPYTTSQVKSEQDILQVGGWSDEVYGVIGSYLNENSKSPNFWLEKIQNVEI